MSKYNAHTEPHFKKLQFLKLNDIFKLQQLNFYYKLYYLNIFNTSLTYTILKFIITTLEKQVVYLFPESIMLMHKNTLGTT